MKDLTIILLTFNEERNLPRCLESIRALECPIFVVDSYSTDGTLDILKENNITFVQHPFENYSRQRNWAQKNNPFNTQWVFHLDAGERFTPELVQWIKDHFDANITTDGFMFSRRTIFFNKWIRRGGHYPNFHLRLYRASKGRCEDKIYDQHFVVDGTTREIGHGIDIIDTVADDLRSFTEAHAKWAVFEAVEILASSQQHGEVHAKFGGTAIERRRWLKNNVFQKAPLFVRAFLYFFYRYFFKLGFLDGGRGLVFHVLQGFWFRFLVDAIVLELRVKMRDEKKTLVEIVTRDYGEKVVRLIQKDEAPVVL